jgi:hypothetical protein
LDKSIQQLEKGEQVDVLFSPKKILANAGLENLSNNEDVQQYIADWTRKLEGLGLMLACHVEYKKRTNPLASKYPKKVKKITGCISKISA